MNSSFDRSGAGETIGLAIGIVTDNVDPEGLARVRVRVPSLWGDGRESWARLAAPAAGKGRGVCFLPEVGDEVLVGAEGGDPGRLYVLGALWNGRAQPPVTNADRRNDVSLIRTRSGHELVFDDDEAAPRVELALNDGKRLVLDGDGVRIDDGRGNAVSIRSGGAEIAIESTGSLRIRAPAVSIEAGDSLSISCGGTLSVNGAPFPVG